MTVPTTALWRPTSRRARPCRATIRTQAVTTPRPGRPDEAPSSPSIDANGFARNRPPGRHLNATSIECHINRTRGQRMPAAVTEQKQGALHVKPGTEWAAVLGRASRIAPDAFGADRLHNLINGTWRATGDPEVLISPVDGSKLVGLPRLSAGEAQPAVHAAAEAHAEWARTPLADRRARVVAAVDAMADVRDELALLLAWEIGKPWKLACADVDRALDGVRWYVEEIESMLGDRTPLPGPVSNIASWNYPMSVLVHAELVQLLAGNAVLAKTPSQGGAACLTLAHALMAVKGCRSPCSPAAGRSCRRSWCARRRSGRWPSSAAARPGARW